MLSAAMRHPIERSERGRTPRLTSAYANQLATRKQIDPSTSGAQIRCRSCASVRSAWVAENVLMLKNTVPTSWTSTAQKSIRRGFQPTSDASRPGRADSASTPPGARSVSWNCR